MFVQFRILQGEVIAVFPYNVCDQHYNVTSYQHTGQHGAAAWDINTFTKAARPDEYASILQELISIGYVNLKVTLRRDHSKYLHAIKCFNEERTGDVIEYRRDPTAYEIKFGEGATHYRSFARSYVTKKGGTLKKWFVDEHDGLRYNQL